MLFKRQRFYAEDQTDKFLRHTFFRSTKVGVMIEVGAAGPQFISMSRHFRDTGWRVIAIEPNPYFIEQYRLAGFDVLPYACGDKDEDGVDFELVFQPAKFYGGDVTYESFSSLKVTDEYRALNPSITSTTIKVNLRRLDTILRDHAPDVGKVDLLSIDVEGWELQVLEGFSLEKFRPIVVVENLMRSAKYVSYMEKRGYRLFAERHPNQIFTPAL
jgi:FkbM family methyltransferase